MASLACDLSVIFECILNGEPSNLERMRSLIQQWFENMDSDIAPKAGSFNAFAVAWNESAPAIDIINATRSLPLARALYYIAGMLFQEARESKKLDYVDDDLLEKVLGGFDAKGYVERAVKEKEEKSATSLGLTITSMGYNGPCGKLFTGLT